MSITPVDKQKEILAREDDEYDGPSSEEILISNSRLLEMYEQLPVKMEIVPKSCWFFNLRKLCTNSTWDHLRHITYAKHFYRCPSCDYDGMVDEDEPSPEGKEWLKMSGFGLHAHELWSYDDEKNIQTCQGVIAQCPVCHSLRHMFLTQRQIEEGTYRYRGRKAGMAQVISHFCEVNRCMPGDFELILSYEMAKYYERSAKEWVCDIGDYFEYVGPQAVPYIADEILIGNYDKLPLKILQAVLDRMKEKEE
jgi:hypothetical protein